MVERIRTPLHVAPAPGAETGGGTEETGEAAERLPGRAPAGLERPLEPAAHPRAAADSGPGVAQAGETGATPDAELQELEEPTKVVPLLGAEERMAGGTKPTVSGLKWALGVTGAILGAMVLVPVSVEPRLLFSWELLGRGPMWSAIYPLYLGASGAVFVLCALMAVPHLFRVGISATAATIPLVMLGSGSGPCGTVASFMNVGWSFWPFLAGCLVAAVGLMMLLHAPRWSASRVMIVVGAGLIAVAMCVPQKGVVPAASALRALTSSHALWPASLVQLVLLTVAILSTVVFLVRSPDGRFLRGSVRTLGLFMAVGLGLTVLGVQAGLLLAGHLAPGQSLGTLAYGTALAVYGVAAVAAWTHLVFWMAGGEIFERGN